MKKFTAFLALAVVTLAIAEEATPKNNANKDTGVTWGPEPIDVKTDGPACAQKVRVAVRTPPPKWQFTLTCKTDSAPTSGFIIDHSVDGTNYVKESEVSGNVSKYTVPPLARRTHCYRVRVTTRS